MSRELEFWNWFSQHQDELLDFETDQERIFDELAERLQRVDPDLTFEFGPKGRQREFVISAAGMRHAFPTVVSLVDAAPRLNRWKITAFRPRRAAYTDIEFRGKRVNHKDVQFSLVENELLAGIYLFIPGFTDVDDELKQIGYLLLDEILGEYDVESRLGLIKMLPPHAQTVGERFPLSELPSRFDELVGRLERHGGRLS